MAQHLRRRHFGNPTAVLVERHDVGRPLERTLVGELGGDALLPDELTQPLKGCLPFRCSGCSWSRPMWIRCFSAYATSSWSTACRSFVTISMTCLSVKL